MSYCELSPIVDSRWVRVVVSSNYQPKDYCSMQRSHWGEGVRLVYVKRDYALGPGSQVILTFIINMRAGLTIMNIIINLELMFGPNPEIRCMKMTIIISEQGAYGIDNHNQRPPRGLAA